MAIQAQDIPAEVASAKQRFSIIGSSPALIRAIARAIRVAPIDLSVLVTGESGAGKEFFPKIIHQFGARKHKKYIAVNCGAIPEGTIDSELFGHEKGSFTGAISARKGYFEEADGGTIFLDEVAELPLTTQARLLRVLETGEFLKVGSSTVQKTNIRIVAATNVDLLKAVEKGKFREDLYYRLSTIRIDVPNLHDRGDDIKLLARKFAADFAEKYMTKPISFSEDAYRAMLVYRWPGNVRQLKNFVEQFALFEAGEEISRQLVLEALPLDRSATSSLVKPGKPVNYEAEREMLWQLMLGMKAEIAELKAAISNRDADHSQDRNADFSGRGSDFAGGSSDFSDRRHSHTSLIKYPVEDLLSPVASSEPTANLSPSDPASRLSSSDPASRLSPSGSTSRLSSSDPASRLSPSGSTSRLSSAEPAAVSVPSLTLEESEKETIIAALERNPSDKKLAAEELGISLRTLYRKIKELGIDS